MATAHKSAISFGLVYIPIGLLPATQDNDTHFHQLHREDMGRIRYQKVCAVCGKEVSDEQIVKGFEFERDRYVLVSDEDIERIKTEKDKTIQIQLFTGFDTIDSVFYETSYYAVPAEGGEKAFELLREAMLQENKVAVAKTVMGSREKLLALTATKDGILVQTLLFTDEIREKPQTAYTGETMPEELEMARLLVRSMDKPFEAATFHDEYRRRLKEMIAQKIDGKEIEAPPAEKAAGVIDLMEALKRSVDQHKAESRTTRKDATKPA
jgi:DNA end-binding protein Ku